MSPPQGLLSPPPLLWVLTKPCGESVRPQSPDGRQCTGGVAEAWTPHTHMGRHSGVSATPIRLEAQAVFDQQTHPLPGDVGGMVGCGWVKSPT